MTKGMLKKLIYDPAKISKEQVAAYAKPFKMPGGKDAFIKTLQSLDSLDFEKMARHYQEIKTPLLLIWGKEDRLMPSSYRTKFCLFANAKVLEIPLCGHIPQEEYPELKQFVHGIKGLKCPSKEIEGTKGL